MRCMEKSPYHILHKRKMQHNNEISIRTNVLYMNDLLLYDTLFNKGQQTNKITLSNNVPTHTDMTVNVNNSVPCYTDMTVNVTHSTFSFPRGN